MYFVLIRVVKTLHQPISTISVSLCKMQIFFQHSLIQNKEELKKKNTSAGSYVFPFPSRSSFPA